MKKLFKIFIAICVMIIFYNCFKIASYEMKEKALEDSINADQYTTEEYNEFQKELQKKSFYYYHNLPEELKDSYISLYFSALDFDEKCKVRLNEEEMKTVIDAVILDNSELFWLTGNYNYTVYSDYVEIAHKYRLKENEAEKISDQLEKKIDGIVSDMPQYYTQFEKELYLHDYVCDNAVYDRETLNFEGQTAYGALLNGKTVCEGYARAVQMLLDEVGIKNYLIVGEASTGNEDELHMWNVVQIDGYNYHLDATWNDGAFTDAQGYFYFNVTDSYIKRTHSNFNVENNNCVYEMANYFKMKNTSVKVFTGFSGLVDATANILRTGENSVEFVFENSSDYKRAVAEIDNQNKFFDYVDKSVRKSGRNLREDKVSYSTVDRYYYITITFDEVN